LDTREKEGHDCAIGVEMVHITFPHDITETIRIGTTELEPCSAQLLTVFEIAETLRVPVSWVYERTRRRGLERMPHIKLGKYLRFDPNTVSEWLKSMQEN
jgi:excisionase family DNA binding protein